MSENGHLNSENVYNRRMNDEQSIFYKAFAARDARFDGIFFVGITSTGIYCRPICTAKLPKQANCRFFKSAEAAEKDFFRPCLRCRPELAPSHSPINTAQRIANLLVSRLAEEQVDEVRGLEEIAKDLGFSSRHIRRMVQKEFGVSPIELVLTRRLLLAKQLLTETNLSILDIAFASGFESLRRFNDAFKKRYGMAPSRLRKENKRGETDRSAEKITLLLNYRPPFDWQGILDFLAHRALQGIEYVDDKCYARTVRIGKYTGWVRVFHVPEKNALSVEISLKLVPVLAGIIGRLRNIFDLNARPDVIGAQLSEDPFLAEDVLKNPGLRVPGAFDGFELAVRAILGQQITVKAATTLSSHFVKAFGEEIQTPFPELHFLCPTPQRIVLVQIDAIASLGIIRRRAQSLLELANEVVSNRLKLEASVDPETTIEQLISIQGIGKWTAHYIAMCALRWPDAFLKEDSALRKKLGGISAKQAEERSQAWRPWRAYATLHLWRKRLS